MDDKLIKQIQKAMTLDKANQEDFVAYDDMDAVRFNFGAMLEPWMVKRVSTAAQEALKVLGNIFDTHNPKVRITPFGDADRERAELAERWAEYHLVKINQRAGKSPIRQLPHTAGKYGRICAQVDYLPYWMDDSQEKWTSEQREQMLQGPYCIELHNPRNVYYGMGKYGLRWAASVTNMSAEEVIDKWGVYNNENPNSKKIQSAVEKLKQMIDGVKEELRFIQVDFTSYDKRVVTVFETSGTGISEFERMSGGNGIEILNADNKMGFLNWVVVECDSTPLLSGIHKGNLYAYQTLLDTVVHSSVMRRAFPPVTITRTMDGKGAKIDYSGAEPEIKLKPNESVEPFVPPPLDQAVFQLAQEISVQVSGALGVSKLGNMDAKSNVQYSTVTAVIDMNMSSLEPYKRAAEKALTQIVYVMFKWVKYSGKTVPAYRLKQSTPDQIVGEEILIAPDSFDDDLLLVVSLKNKNDEMSAVNKATMLKQGGFRVPDSELLEDLGYENPEMLASKWKEEQLESAALQNFIAELQAQLQLKQQAASMQMQAEQQQAMQQQAMQQQATQEQQMAQEQQAQAGQMEAPDQGLPSNVSGQGFNGAMGGTPPMMAEPGMTATQIPNSERAQ